MNRARRASDLLGRPAERRFGIRYPSSLRVNFGAAPSRPAARGSRRGPALLVIMAALAGCGDAQPTPAHLRIAGAEPEKGRALIQAYGCGTCHAIGGVRGARGTVGPSLEEFAQRSVVAGILPNTPQSLVAWLLDPPAHDSRTAMPSVGLAETEARHIAAYLYTLGAEGASVYPPDPPLDYARSGSAIPDTLRRSVAPVPEREPGAGGR